MTEHIHPSLRGLAVELQKLTPDPKNARKHDERNLDAIRESLAEHGQRKPLVAQQAGKKLIVRAGNGTLEAAKRLGWTHLAVVVVEEDDRAASRYALRDNRSAELAAWDDEALYDALKASIDEPHDAVMLGWSQEELAALAQQFDQSGQETQGEKESPYTDRIKAPIYEPTGPRPNIADLFDITKTMELVEAIEAAKLPHEVAVFLKAAAARHTVFDFSKIANFYAHSSADVQRLMEQSALIIIDFESAIEYGFVKMTEKLGKLVELEKAADDA